MLKLPYGTPTLLRYIVLLSGLNVGSNHSDQLSVEMMVDYLTGFCGAPEDQKQMSKVVRVVVAGNSITDKPAKIAMQDQKVIDNRMIKLIAFI